jgi:hypothetical protein
MRAVDAVAGIALVGLPPLEDPAALVGGVLVALEDDLLADRAVGDAPRT